MTIRRSRILVVIGAVAGITGAIFGCSSTAAGPDHHKDAGGADDSGPVDGGPVTDGEGTPDTGVVACLDDRSAFTDPDGGDGGVDCASNADGTCQSSCQDVFNNLKAGVAYEAAACIVKLPACDGQPTDVVQECVDKAAAKACADPTTPPYCQVLFDSCADAGVDTTAGDAGAFKPGCAKLVAALNDTGRDAFLTCMTDNGGANCADPSVCIRQVKH